MLVYILGAIFIFIVYYFVEQGILNRSLIKAGKQYGNLISTKGQVDIEDIKEIRKKTDFYDLNKSDKVFISINYNNPDIALLDLEYKELARFKKLIKDSKNNKLGCYEFFIHKNYKHLLYPYKLENGLVGIVLLQTINGTTEDFFNKKPK